MPRVHVASSAQREEVSPKARIWPVVSLLPILIAGGVLKPAGVVTVLGIDTTVLSMVILLAATILTFLGRPAYPIRAMLPFLLFAVVVLGGVAMSDLGEYQTMKARDFFLLTGVIIACIPVLLRDVRDLRGLVFTWLLVGSIAGATALLVGGAEALNGREGIGESTLGPAYLAAMGLVVGCTAWSERQIAWSLAVPIVAVTGIAVVTIGARGPMLSAMAGLAAWALLRGVLRKGTILAVFALGAAVFLGLTLASNTSADRLFMYHDLAREDLWNIARLAFLEHPLLGIGWGDYSTVGWAQYPHNAFLEVGVELGLLGIAAFIGLLLTGAARTWSCRSLGEVRVLGAVAAVALTGQQFSSDLTNRVFWIALAPTLLFTALVHVSPSLGVPATQARAGWVRG